MNYRNYISINRMKILETTDKDNCLDELIDLFDDGCGNKTDLRKAIFYRESLMSTGIGLGIAIPHVRTSEIEKISIAFGIQKAGIDNYESIDNEPVKLVFMIIANKIQHKEHIKILSSLMTKLKEPAMIDKMMEADRVEEIYNLLKE